MKRSFLFLWWVLGPVIALGQMDSIFHDGQYRTYLPYAPASYNGASPTPLIIAMHGGFGSATNLQHQSQLSLKADSAGFIVVYPEGVESTLGIRTWNAGGCCGYAMNNNIDDVGFISALLDTLETDYNIDTNRVYATGMSNGAFMSYRLACELSHRIAAIAPVAGTMNVSFCDPQRPVPVIHFHSYNDSNVPYQGGVGSGASNHYNPPLDSVLNVWAGNNSCSTLNDTVHDGADYDRVDWASCSCQAEARLYITHDGSHSWPGGNQTPSGDPVSTAINADQRMWGFFQKHSLACPSPSSVGPKDSRKEEIRLYPNPSSDKVMLQFPENKPPLSIKLTDLSGRTLQEFGPLPTGKSSLRVGNLDHSPGIYLFHIMTRSGQETHKFLIRE